MARQATKVPIKKKKTSKRQKSKKSIVKASGTFTPLATLREEIDSLFERFSQDWPHLPKALSKGWIHPFASQGRQQNTPNIDLIPSVDISESDDSYKISMELPGMTEKDIELTLTDDSLTVNGEKKEEYEEKKKNYYISERSYGSFQRTFQIPTGVESKKINANYSKGVLNISLPKTELAKKSKRTIDVKVA